MSVPSESKPADRPDLPKRTSNPIAGKDLVAILPRSELFVVAANDSVDSFRWAGLFAETWRRLPPGVQRRLLASWPRPPLRGGLGVSGSTPAEVVVINDRRPSSVEPQRMVCPVLSQRPEDLRSEESRQQVLGLCALTGVELRFQAPSVARMPDQVAHVLIAHKLADLFQQLLGYKRCFGTTTPTEEELADDAKGTVELWGFDHSALDAWLVANC